MDSKKNLNKLLLELSVKCKKSEKAGDMYPFMCEALVFAKKHIDDLQDIISGTYLPFATDGVMDSRGGKRLKAKNDQELYISLRWAMNQEDDLDLARTTACGLVFTALVKMKLISFISKEDLNEMITLSIYSAILNYRMFLEDQASLQNVKSDTHAPLLNFFSNSLTTVFMVAYFGSVPLALIFGDKWDVVISLFVPAYGFVVMIGSFFS